MTNTLPQENALLEENWSKIKERVLLPLWNGKFRFMYQSLKLDYDDFESLAGFELSKAIRTFDPEKSNLFTFSTRVVTQKAYSEMRDCTRDKKKTLHTADNIDDITEACNTETIEDNELSEKRVGSFINSLNNNQLRVLILMLLDFDKTEMPEMLKMSPQTIRSILNSLKDSDLTRILYKTTY